MSDKPGKIELPQIFFCEDCLKPALQDDWMIVLDCRHHKTTGLFCFKTGKWTIMLPTTDKEAEGIIKANKLTSELREQNRIRKNVGTRWN